MLTGIGLTIFKQIRIGLNDSVKSSVLQKLKAKSNKKPYVKGLVAVYKINNKIILTDILTSSVGRAFYRLILIVLGSWINSPALFCFSSYFLNQ